MTTDDVGEVSVRLATAADAVAIADLYTAARVAAVPSMPPALHTNAEDRAFVARKLTETDEVWWVAERDGELVGFAATTPTWLDGLYVRPDLTGQGIGSMLLDLVKSTHPDGLSLWVFESNTGARRLYLREGFVEVEHTDGSGNEERAPDLRMEWRGSTPD